MNLRFHDYRFADAVLDHANFRAAKEDVLRILRAAPVPLLNPEELDPRRGGVKRRRRKAEDQKIN